jgi:hypothetical protein
MKHIRPSVAIVLFAATALTSARAGTFHAPSEFSAVMGDYIAKGYTDSSHDGITIWESEWGNCLVSFPPRNGMPGYELNCYPPNKSGEMKCTRYDMRGNLVGIVHQHICDVVQCE